MSVLEIKDVFVFGYFSTWLVLDELSLVALLECLHNAFFFYLQSSYQYHILALESHVNNRNTHIVYCQVLR